MREDISKLIEDLKKQIAEKVAKLVGPAGKKFQGTYVAIDEFDGAVYYIKYYELVAISIEGSSVLVLLEDEDHFQEWTYLRDLSLGDLGRILELL